MHVVVGLFVVFFHVAGTETAGCRHVPGKALGVSVKDMSSAQGKHARSLSNQDCPIRVLHALPKDPTIPATRK